MIRGRRRDAAALLVCALFGVFLAAYPHFLALVERGEAVYVADPDELFLYLPVGADAVRDHPLWLEDPVPSGGGRTMYPWLQLGPGVVLARLLGWGPLGVSFAWRLLAGACVGGLLYVLLRQRLRLRWLALAGALVLLGDVGVVYGKLLVRQAIEVARMAAGGQGHVGGWPGLHANWRLISPALSLPWLLLTLICWLRLQERGTWRRRALAGVSLGLLVPVYFYAWTAAFFALVLWFVAEPKRRRDLIHVGWIALLVAAPALIAGALAKADAVEGWLQRSDKFVPIARTSSLLWPKGAMACAALGIAWVARARRDLLPVLALGLAGLLLLNHQLVSGLQIENWHWQYAYGPALSVLVVLLGAGALEARWERVPRVGRLLLGASLALHLSSGLALRDLEAQAPQSRAATDSLLDFRAQRGAGPSLPEGLVAGEQSFVAAALVLAQKRPLEHPSVRFSPAIGLAAWRERIALDALLRGLEVGAFRAEQEGRMKGFFSNWLGDAAERERRLAERVRVFHATREALEQVLERLNVRCVGLPVGQTPPAYLRQGWRRLEEGPRWQVWVRD
mgnify:CR=1 FL=1